MCMVPASCHCCCYGCCGWQVTQAKSVNQSVLVSSWSRLSYGARLCVNSFFFRFVMGSDAKFLPPSVQFTVLSSDRGFDQAEQNLRMFMCS